MIDFHTLKTIIKRELRDSIRDWRIMMPVLLLTSLFPFLMNFTAAAIFDFLENYSATLIGERLIPFGVMIVGFFPITFSLVIALEAFVGEKERNSLEALLATPASDLELYLGKLIASLILPLIASYVGIAVYLVFVSQADFVELPQILLFQIVLLTTLKGLGMVSGAVIVSSHTTSVRAANLLASFIIIPAALLVQIEAVFMFFGSYEALWYIALGLIVVNIILVRAGMRTFNREVILSREMDTLNPKAIARKAIRFWRALPTEARIAARTSQALPNWSLSRFYRVELRQLLQQSRLPIAVSLLMMIASFIFGWGFAYRYPLPPDFINFDELVGNVSRDSFVQASQGWSVLPNFDAFSIFWHNLRASILAVTFGLFSFGSLSLLLIGLPMALVGFLAGQAGGAGTSAGLFLATFILPHGIIELPATMLATAFALRIGAALISPPEPLTVGEAMLLTVGDFFKILLFVVTPMLLLSSLIEVYITPEIIMMVY